MLMDLCHGKNSVTAAVTLSAILTCALDASAQSNDMAISDKPAAIVGSPEVTAAGGSAAARKALSAAALRAVLRSSPFTMLPKENYESWREVVLRFESGDPTP
ncbi:hypothetical protein AMC90_CH03642 [Rhizobium phaseoli]|uniref:Uncharacterized protein n=1 Tax=Rhizobium etli (strain CIAT 652) TaxID=491916 RepID=B3PYX6_RHIE6|nr:hypothetical protein [Rhizobium phaseoli]ACE92640.1 hypothetical protein RHECIAT_CH0003702 [Rhizobium etli CIAT 652]ANL29411.1 hypothetical protein AMC90_CH03642 [Rhizobium phaseoli]MDK4730274.1 hypothetical protein [Rhizobium phaseoli]NKE89966.1 hypothetical protein [Rhizobium phaseoli]PCD66677.1 hypothetical protein CO648_18230 [Rhizobium phaseoli]